MNHTHSVMFHHFHNEDQNKEYMLNYNYLSKLLGNIVSMSHPCGDYNNETLSILSKLGI